MESTHEMGRDGERRQWSHCGRQGGAGHAAGREGAVALAGISCRAQRRQRDEEYRMRGGEEEAEEPLEEPVAAVPDSGGRCVGRREAGAAVGGEGAAQDLEEQGEGGAEGGEEAAAEGGGGAERRELPELARVHCEGGATLIEHARHLACRRLVSSAPTGTGDMAHGREQGSAGGGRQSSPAPPDHRHIHAAQIEGRL